MDEGLDRDVLHSVPKPKGTECAPIEFADLGPQREPSSPSKIEAERKATARRLAELLPPSDPEMIERSLAAYHAGDSITTNEFEKELQERIDAEEKAKAGEPLHE